jgi:hypothetical protein
MSGPISPLSGHGVVDTIHQPTLDGSVFFFREVTLLLEIRDLR